jgi:hypothetical protein
MTVVISSDYRFETKAPGSWILAARATWRQKRLNG